MECVRLCYYFKTLTDSFFYQFGFLLRCQIIRQTTITISSNKPTTSAEISPGVNDPRALCLAETKEIQSAGVNNISAVTEKISRVEFKSGHSLSCNPRGQDN